MTGATYVGCYSTLPTVTPTSACERFYPEGDLTLISETYWYDGVTVVGEIVSLIATSPATSTRTYSISPEQFDSFLVAVSVEPMVTMIHKEEDVKAGTAATSNAAIRLGSRSSWDGIGGVAAVCALGMVLGAAIIVPL